MEDLNNVSNEIFTKMYQNMQQQAPNTDNASNDKKDNNGDDEVIVE